MASSSADGLEGGGAVMNLREIPWEMHELTVGSHRHFGFIAIGGGRSVYAGGCGRAQGRGTARAKGADTPQ